MRANRIHRFGGPEVISFEEVERPEPAARQVLVRVAAAGVGPWDGWVRGGRSVLPQPLPLTLGAEISGLVEAVGSDVTEWQRGDEVFGVPNERFTDAHAELALASAAMIAKKPRSFGHVQAASMPIGALTAWQMLFEGTDITAGTRVLVLGVGGNVGGYAAQLVRYAGAHLVETENEPVDLVIDAVGGEAQQGALARLSTGGTLVSAVSAPDAALAERRGVRARFLLVRSTTELLGRLAGLADNGVLVPRVGAVLALDELRAAHEMLEGKRFRPRGKIVLRV